MMVLLFIVGGFVFGFICMALFLNLFKPVDKDVETAYIDECIKVMVAYKEGYKIEYMLLDGSDGLVWHETDKPEWNFGSAYYRVKKGINKYW